MGRRTNSAQWLPNQQRWQIKVQKNGERRAFTSATPGRTGQREANRKADAWLDEGICVTRRSVGDLYPEWLDEVKQTTSRANWEPMESRWRTWIAPSLGRCQVDALTEQRLQAVVNRCFAAGRSKKYLSNICADLRAFCKWLRLSRLSTLYPEALHVPRSARTQEKEILQPEALQTLFTVDTTLLRGCRVPDPYIHAYRFAAVTGLRPGELVGLRWSDIRGTTVQVRRSINVYGELTRGKNDNALRSFALSYTAEDVLRSQRQLTGGEEYVFGISSEGQFRKRWRAYCDANGLPYVPPYNLRHTFVSLAKTLPEGAVKSLVGHSRQMDTYGVYAHLVQGEAAQTAQALEKVLGRVLGRE